MIYDICHFLQIRREKLFFAAANLGFVINHEFVIIN